MTRDQENDYLAELGYMAYARSTENRNFLGQEMPQWTNLPDRIKLAWRAAAEEIRTRTARRNFSE